MPEAKSEALHAEVQIGTHGPMHLVQKANADTVNVGEPRLQAKSNCAATKQSAPKATRLEQGSYLRREDIQTLSPQEYKAREASEETR